MEKKNNSGMLVGILIGIIITLLVVGGLFATGTIGFKTSTTTDNGQTSENNQTDNSNITSSDDYDAESIAKEKMPTVLSLAHQMEGQYTLYAYCGTRDRSDLTKGNFYYSISKKYKMLSELKEYLNTIMTKEIYDKYFLNDSDKYIEQDGKLYCAYAPTDGLVTRFMSEDSINNLDNLKYTVSNKTSSSFDAILSFTYSSEIEGVTNKEYKYTASFVKDNNNWLINFFEQQ